MNALPVVVYVSSLAVAVTSASYNAVANTGDLMIYTVVALIIIAGVVHLFFDENETMYGKKGESWRYDMRWYLKYAVMFMLGAIALAFAIETKGAQSSNASTVRACAWSNTTSCLTGSSSSYAFNSICGGAYTAVYPLPAAVSFAIYAFALSKLFVYVFAALFAINLKVNKEGVSARRSNLRKLSGILFWCCYIVDMLVNMLYLAGSFGSGYYVGTDNPYSVVAVFAMSVLGLGFGILAAKSVGLLPKFANESHDFFILAFMFAELYAQTLFYSDSMRPLAYSVIVFTLPCVMAKWNDEDEQPFNCTNFFKVFAVCNAVFYVLVTSLFMPGFGLSTQGQMFLPLNEKAYLFAPMLFCGPTSFNVNSVLSLVYGLAIPSLIACVFFLGSNVFELVLSKPEAT